MTEKDPKQKVLGYDMEDPKEDDPLIQFNVKMNATDNFISDLLLGKDEFPLSHTGENRGEEELRLAVMVCGKELRRCGKQRPVTVYRFVLMDGDQALVSAVVNSGYAHKMHGRKLVPGAMLNIYDWVPIREQRKSQNQRRLTLVLNRFSWSDPPEGTKGNYDYMMAIEECGPFVHDWGEVRCSAKAIRHCYDTRLICFIEPFEEGDYDIWRLADTDKLIETGKFIRDPVVREQFLTSVKPPGGC